MKKLNKKGFTLIELLAVIIILGVLLLIAVPSVSKYIQQSRERTYKSNLSKFVDAVTNDVNAMDYDSPYSFNSSEYLVIPIVCIDIERGSNEKSPFAEYNKNESFVLVTRKTDSVTGSTSGFEYYVAARDANGFGTSLSYPDTVVIKTLSDDDTSVITSTTLEVKNAYNSPALDNLTAKVVTCTNFS